MIYRIFIAILLISTVIYYIFCFLQIFNVIRFTDDDVEIDVPQMFIPFYYIIKKGQKSTENENDTSEPVEKVMPSENEIITNEPIKTVTSSDDELQLPKDDRKPKRDTKGRYTKSTTR